MKQHILIPHIKTGLVAAVAVPTLLFVGGTAGATQMHEMPQQHPAHVAMMSHEYSHAGEDLRVALNNLLREHVTTNVNVNRSIVAHDPQAMIDAAMQAQYVNSDALAGAIGSIYGDAAKGQFSELFNEHLVQSNHYAVAAAAGDITARDAANVELQEYLHELATFFSTAIPGLPYQDAYGMLNEHEELVNKATNAYQAGDYAASYALEREALKQVSMVADALTKGIVATQPDKF